MELYNEIILNVLLKELSETALNSLQINSEKIVDLESYKTIARIKRILEDDSLNDSDCFKKIEAIVRTFEELGSDCGHRHNLN